jgi:hypothetical protein
MEVAFICIPMPECYKTFMSVVTMERRNIERIPKFIMSDCYWVLCSRDSILGRAIGLRAVRSGVRILVGAGDVSILRDFQTGFGAHQHSLQWILGVKRLVNGVEFACISSRGYEWVEFYLFYSRIREVPCSNLYQSSWGPWWFYHSLQANVRIALRIRSWPPL